MFKIIGIELLQPPSDAVCMMSDEQLEGLDMTQRFGIDLERGRYQTIHKGLKIGKPYLFYSGYEVVDGAVGGRGILPGDFFAENISVCGIVGENGSGKSTIMELIIRLMNNSGYALRAAFAATDPNDDDYHLHFVSTIYARMYVETNDGFYTITQVDRDLEVSWQSEKKKPLRFHYVDNTQPPTIDKGSCISELKSLFYTIVVNYAAYAYNIYDYSPEWTHPKKKAQPQTQAEDEQTENYEFVDDEHRCWIGSLFHKNDGYQAPVVLNPYRSRGNINYNNENTLLRDRLFFLLRSVKKEVLGNILQGKIPQTFILDENNEYNQLTGKDFYSLRVVDQMYRGHYLTNNESENIMRVASKGNLIIKAWSEVMRIDLMNAKREDNSDYLRALNYVVYKTLKITHTYDDYHRYKFRLNQIEDIRMLVHELSRKSNHITKKLRRTLAYLTFQHIGTSFREDDLGKMVDIEYFMKCAIEYCMRQTGEIIWELDDLMPAPCFRTDIRFQLPNGSLLPLSQFSSGEKQMLHLVCTIIYHLININGNALEPRNKVGYKYVNLMIDEIELYFHPRYQTMLTDFILNAITQLRLKGIQGINMMIATHSPYLLSDIPKCNVLRLRQGEVELQDGQKENFGANVYDILHSQFFMDCFMGNFAFGKIRELVFKVEKSYMQDQRYREALRHEIMVIGDTFIKNTLLRKLDEYDQT